MTSVKPTSAPKVLPTICKKKPRLCNEPRMVCPGGCLPGQCVSARCPFRMFGQVLYGHPELEEEQRFRAKCFEKARAVMKQKERFEYLNAQRRFATVKEISEEDYMAELKKNNRYVEMNDEEMKKCPKFTVCQLKIPDGQKSMRGPARPLCMLEVPPYTPPIDDYSELSRFLRVSTMPGYSNNELVSEYKDNHNMSVWNNRKDIDQQVYKFKKDWLSNWGEFNVKEQRWRKAWVEKFGAETK